MRDFIYGALTEDFVRTAFKKVPEKQPTAIFYDEKSLRYLSGMQEKGLGERSMLKEGDQCSALAVKKM